jgi:hypothetical protein
LVPSSSFAVQTRRTYRRLRRAKFNLVVLDVNPLENIPNTDNVTQVMLGGRLYEL